MVLSHLELENFRCYRELRLPLPSGLTVLIGPNAQGKTAFLEALYVLASARSFRATADGDLIRWETEQARVTARARRDSGRERTLELSWKRAGRGTRKEVLLMNQPVAKLAELLREVPLALFTPSDLELVGGGPSGRRRYLDYLLCKLYPAYLSSLSRYQKVVRQRNELLRKRPAPGPAELEPWDGMAASTGAAVTSRRAEIVAALDESFREFNWRLSQEDARAELVYRPSGPTDPGSYLDELSRLRSEELRRGSSLLGPHRDELEIRLGGVELRRFGSQGQQRTAALSLRLAQAQIMGERTSEGTVILLDDCFSELDGDRQARLLESLVGYPQVFVTSATPLDLPVQATVFQIRAGKITPA